MYRLPEALRGELAAPLGPVYPDDEGVAAARSSPFVVAVGDVTTERLIGAGVVPRVAVVDHHTKRHGHTASRGFVEGLRARGASVVPVDNPAATISEDLWNALATAFTEARDGGVTVVDVTGEEDLATLPAILLAPKGAAVCYGQPDEGMVVVVVDDALRARARDLLDRMER